MARTSYLPLLIASALAVGWAVSAVDYNEYEVSAVQPGSIPEFPYRTCNKTNGAYRLAPVYSISGGGTYCFTIKVDQDPPACSGPCCDTDLHKIEFNISNSCLVPGASVSATLNGVPTRVSPSFDKPPAGPVGATTLKITQLGLDPVTAQDAELCITLRPNRARQGCTTLEQLCSSPGFPAGTCTAATFDLPCDCCPISTIGQAQPPPPSPSPPVPASPFAPAIRQCDVCFIARLLPPDNDIRPYYYDNATCVRIQQTIASDMNYFLRINGIEALTPYAFNDTGCSGRMVLTCGSFNGYNSVLLAQLVTNISEGLGGFVETAAGGNICKSQLEGYSVEVTTEGNQCLDVSLSASCFLPENPFPNCTCNTTQGVLPFVVSSTYYEQPSTYFFNSTEYCFTINTLAPSQIFPSTCYKSGDLLAKIEFNAKESIRPAVRGFNITAAGAVSRKVSPSWGAAGSATLKVNLNWNDVQANGGVVCVAIQKPFTMGDLCMADYSGQCYISLFNRESSIDCCPTFRTGP